MKLNKQKLTTILANEQKDDSIAYLQITTLVLIGTKLHEWTSAELKQMGRIFLKVTTLSIVTCDSLWITCSRLRELGHAFPRVTTLGWAGQAAHFLGCP